MPAPVDWAEPSRLGLPEGAPMDPRTVDWDFLLVHLKSGEDLPCSDWLSKPDAYVKCRVGLKDGISPHGPVDGGAPEITQCTFPCKEDQVSPAWDRMKQLCFNAKAAKFLSDYELVIELIDSNSVVFGDTLMVKRALPLPKPGTGWEPHTVELQGGGKLHLALKSFKEPFFTREKDYEPLGLNEVALDTPGASNPMNRASLAFRTEPGNKKMLLMLPGRCDCFTHPHVAKAFLERGFDFFHLDYRRVGRARKFLAEREPSEHLVSHSKDFDEYIEDINGALQFIQTLGNTYTHKVWMGHSTAGPILLNYILRSEEKDAPFTQLMLNSPFMDWGQVDAFSEFVLEKVAGKIGWAAGDSTPIPGRQGKHAVNTFHIRSSSLFWSHPNHRPLFVRPAVTTGWAQAVTQVHERVQAAAGKVTHKPVYVITSESDEVLDARETMAMADCIGSNVEKVCLRYNSHDVFLSPDWDACMDALNRAMAWVDKQTACPT